MKLFVTALLVCAICAQHVSCYGRNQQYSDYTDNDQVQQQSEQRSKPLTRLRLTPSKGGDILSSILTDEDFAVIDMPQAVPFFEKIVERLNNSRVLQAATEIKDRIVYYAATTLKECKSVDGQSLNTHCTSRLIGKIMQLIAAMERLQIKLPFGQGQRAEGPVAQSESNY